MNASMRSLVLLYRKEGKRGSGGSSYRKELGGDLNSEIVPSFDLRAMWLSGKIKRRLNTVSYMESVHGLFSII